RLLIRMGDDRRDQPHRARDPDRRRAPHAERRDSLAHLIQGAQLPELLPFGEERLVQYAYAAPILCPVHGDNDVPWRTTRVVGASVERRAGRRDGIGHVRNVPVGAGAGIARGAPRPAHRGEIAFRRLRWRAGGPAPTAHLTTRPDLPAPP